MLMMINICIIDNFSITFFMYPYITNADDDNEDLSLFIGDIDNG